MQFLYSAFSSNELKALLHIITPSTPLHTNTFSTPQRSIQPGYTLQGTTGDQCIIAFSVCCQVLIYGWVNQSTFPVQILPRDSSYRRLSVWMDLNLWSRGWESSALTTRPTVLPHMALHMAWHKHWTPPILRVCCTRLQHIYPPIGPYPAIMHSCF